MKLKEKSDGKLYRAVIPFIPSMGAIMPIVCRDKPLESKEQELLWHLNKMREHDGQRPLRGIPKGVKWEEIESRRT